jgi:hypothetical protein
VTAVCGGGPSETRPGIVGTAFNTAAGVTAFLSSFLPLPLAIAIGAIAAVETFDVGEFCATDPPADPGLTAQDMVDLLNPSALDTWLPAQAKVRTWWRHVYWWQVCQCSAVPTPAPPAFSNPGNQAQNASLPSGSVAPCYESTAPWITTGATSGRTTFDITSVWIPQTTDTIAVSVPFPAGAVAATAFRIPYGVTAMQWITQNHGATSQAGSNAVNVSLEFFTAAGASAGGAQFLTSQAVQIGPLTPNEPVPSTAAYIAIVGENESTPQLAGLQLSWSVDLQFICGGIGVQSPCCPPDPALELKVNQLLQLVIDLAGRSATAPPISWHDGVSHSALGGSGSFLIDPTAIGIRFNVTTPPSGVTVDPGNPDFYWDMGFWAPYALGSPLRGGRIVFLSQSVELPEFSDQVGYTLKNGTIMSATELLPTTS